MKSHLHQKALAVAIAAATTALVAGNARADATQSGEQKNMRRVGHSDIQGRPAYQPNAILYPNGRTYAFIGTHTGSRPNPLKGNVVEQNGTMIVDVTNPAAPVDKFHIPVPIAGGQAQMARMCLGSDLPFGTPGHVYLMRNIQGTTASGFEVWDVTNVTAPVLVGAQRGVRSTHKPYWECSTGIAYLPGSPDGSAGLPIWRQAQSMVIVNWSDPARPQYLRTFGLPGGQPSGTGAVPPSLHGAISAHDHPNANRRLARGATFSDIIGNRVYAAWGVGDDGVLQALDRNKLLPAPFGSYIGDPNNPTDAQLESSQASILYMSPDQGGHTTMPVFGLLPPSYQNFTEFQVRDVLVVTSEATSNKCQEAPHWASIVDVTVENSKTAPPGTRVEHNPWQGPAILSTMSVDPRLGEKYARGNYCARGARFGSHAAEENFNNPYYGKLTFITYFTGGIRVWDIREPQAPVEVAFYVPQANANTTSDGYMTNNVEVDDRGYVYVVDRNGAGLDILRVTGKARRIVFPNDTDRSADDD
jgi:hypothetical protein